MRTARGGWWVQLKFQLALKAFYYEHRNHPGFYGVRFQKDGRPFMGYFCRVHGIGFGAIGRHHDGNV